MRLAVIQNLPLEYYPPVTNLLDLLSREKALDVRVFSVENSKNRPPYSKEGIQIVRAKVPQPGQNLISRALLYVDFIRRTLVGLIRFRPQAILYFEPHSALPVYLYSRLFSRSTTVFIHHHEYYEPEQYSGRGMRLTRLAHLCETHYLFSKASWISQTNPKRRELFLCDYPGIDPEKVHVMPNYPPSSWGLPNRAWKETGKPLRCLYLGSLSREDTFIEPLVAWIQSAPHDVFLDIYAYNVPAETAAWLAGLKSDRIRFFSAGIDYEKLPEILPDYQVGLILYRGNTRNFIWNAPNKLFEYLACGLDVWYPPVMSGIHPFRSEDTSPRVLEVDFEEMDRIPFEKLSQRGNLGERNVPYDAETAVADLLSHIRNHSMS